MDIEEYIGRINEAIKLFQNGREAEVLSECQKLIDSKPERVGAYLLLSQVYSKQNQLYLAENILKEGQKQTADDSLLMSLGIIQTKLKKYEDAISVFRLVKVRGKNRKFHFYFAKALAELGLIEEAIDEYKECLKLDPNHRASLNNLANLSQRKGDHKEAIRFYQRLIDIYPDEAIGYCNLGGAYEQESLFEKARSCYEKSLEINPKLSITYFNLSQLQAKKFNDYKGALQFIEDGLKHGDERFREGLRFYQILFRKIIADWTDYSQDKNDLIKIIDEYLEGNINLPFEIVPYTLSYMRVENERYRAVAEKYAEKITDEVKVKYQNLLYDHSSSPGKLKVGYLSPNFRKHPGGVLVRKLFEFHDSSQFEIHGFSLVQSSDFINNDIKNDVDYYHDVSELRTKEIADLINRCGIDILVGLAGYNTNMNMEVFALRPAPVQMMMIGSHETSGASFIDYVFSDESMMDASLRKNFTEQVITLPCSSLINSELPLDETKNTTRADHNLPQNTFVYASFNHPRKLDPETLDAWMQIIQTVPNSILWLFDGGLEQFRVSIHNLANSYHVEHSKVIFASPVDLHTHWERMRHADLFLDSFQYNAHVTGVEALRMGVPMISLRGDNHNSRLGSSLLHYSGLKNCAISTKNDYIELSILAASEGNELKGWREKLESKHSSILFDTELQVKYLEKSYRKALFRHRKGLPPKDFSVGSALELNFLE
ncbi:MAG: tetratricopeptide repeat protein [Ekhidna sp.]